MRRLCATAALCTTVLTAGIGMPVRAQVQQPENLHWRALIHSSSVDTDEIFPATILALATAPSRGSRPTYIGDPNGVLGVTIQSPSPNARVQVSVKVDQLSEVSTLEATLPQANQVYEIWPKIRFDARALATVRESFPTTAVFSLALDGAAPMTQSRTIRVRSINDVPFAYITNTGQVQDFGFMFAAFVNENSPQIDKLLKEALRVNAVPHFIGYQGTTQDVVRQVFAVWNVLQRHGVRYSSITRPSGTSQSVISQHVRFIDEIIDNEQANCADGSLLFASVLYKLGIYPALVVVPGHMFVGFFADKQRQQPMFLETTMIGAPTLSSMERGWRFLTNDGYLSSRSYQLFQQAVAVGNQKFQQAAPHLKAKERGYLLIDIDVVRRAGIAPIPRFESGQTN